MICARRHPRAWKILPCGNWDATPAPVCTFAQPRWDGKPLDGKPILLHAEQGLGDTIQFVRYAKLVQQRGGTVLVESPPALMRLFARRTGIDRLIPQRAPLPDFACHAPFLSLPGIFHTTLATVPTSVPYLSPEPALVQEWGEELAKIEGLKIGIAWQGSKQYGGDAHRSIPLRAFEPLTRLPGVCLISLQKGFGSEQIREVGKGWNIVDFGAKLDADAAFVDTAAIMSHLDLVISSDSAIVHLAGALGVPIWVALCRAADWRWLRHGETTPWYPTMRLFRQKEWGKWDHVFRSMARQLQQTCLAVRAPAYTAMAPAELLDKITILEIKRKRVSDKKKLAHVRVELGALLSLRDRSLRRTRMLDELIGQLKAVNEELWQIEDDIREHEHRKDFGERFIELARSVYQKNDHRAAVKRAINELLRSQIIEEKSYACPVELVAGGRG